MNTCEKCNNPVPVEKAFCPNCGAAMTPERERAMEFISEEMLPTMYEQDPPAKNPATPKPPSTPVKVEASSTPPAISSTQRRTPTAATNRRNVASTETPDASGNRILYSILVAAAVLFTISIIIVAVLYMMGRI